MKYVPSLKVADELARQGLNHIKHEVELDEIEFNTWLEKFRQWHPEESASELVDRVGYFLAWKKHGNPNTAQSSIFDQVEQKFSEAEAKVKKYLKYIVIGAILAVIWLTLLTVKAFAQVDCVKVQQAGVTVGNSCAPFTINFAGATCSVSKTGSKYDVNCSTGSITNNPGGSAHNIQINNGAGAFSGLGNGTLGQIMTSQGPSADPVFADPLVQGTQAAGSTTIPNPVVIGGSDYSGTPTVRVWKTDSSGFGYVVFPSAQHVVVDTAPTTAVTGTFWQATQPVSAASLPLPSGAATAAKQPALGTAGTPSADVISVQGVTSMAPLKVDGSGVTQPVSGTFWQTTQPVSWSGQTVSATQSGTWTVQPGNTANTTPWLFQIRDAAGNARGANVNASNQLSVSCDNGCAGGSSTPADTFSNPTTAGLSMNFPMVWNGTTWDRLYGDKTNGAFVNVKNSSIAVTGTFWQATQPVSGTVAATQSGNWTARVVGNAGAAVDAANGAAPPANQIAVAGLGSGATGGTMEMIPVGDTYAAINVSTATTTRLVTGVSGRQVRISSLHIIVAGAQTAALIEGTGATCGTGTAGMSGGTTAATGWSFAANGGMTLGSGVGSVIQTATAGDSVCLVTGSAVQTSGGLQYSIY